MSLWAMTQNRSDSLLPLRTRRLKAGDLEAGHLQVSFTHRFSDGTGARVDDFHAQGAGLVLPAETGPFLEGDVLETLHITHGGETVFNGVGIVRHVQSNDEEHRLGIAFQGSSLDLGRLYGQSMRMELAERTDSVLSMLDQVQSIDPVFKALVADMKYSLTEVKAYLDEEERRLDALDQVERATTRAILVEQVATWFKTQLQALEPTLRKVSPASGDPLEQTYRSYLQKQLHADLMPASLLLRRCYQKPLGYAGDYEIMNMLYDRTPIPGTLFADALHAGILKLPQSQAVRNRIPYLAKQVAVALEGKTGTSMASIASGPAHEVTTLLETHGGSGLSELTLLDVEDKALRYCEGVVLPELSKRAPSLKVNLVQQSVRTFFKMQSLEGVMKPMDVIVSVGLMDYLPDALFSHLTKLLYGVLKPGGTLILGNMQDDHLSLFLMNYVTEWFLIYRNKEDLLRIAECLPPEAEVAVEMEPEAVNLFLRVRKPG